MIHPNGFRVALIFFNKELTKNFGQIVNRLQGAIQVDRPWWKITEADSGAWREMEERYNGYGYSKQKRRELKRQAEILRGPHNGPFAVEHIGEFHDNRWAFMLTFASTTMVDIIDGYPFRTEIPNGPSDG